MNMNTPTATVHSHQQGLPRRQNLSSLITGFLIMAALVASAQNINPQPKPGLKRLVGFSVEAAIEHLPKSYAGKSAGGSLPPEQAETSRMTAGITRQSTGDLYGLVTLEEAEKYLKTRRTKLHKNGALEEVVGYLVQADGKFAHQVHDSVEEIEVHAVGGYFDRSHVCGTTNDVVKFTNLSQSAQAVSIARAAPAWRTRTVLLPPNGSVTLPLAGSAVGDWNSVRDDIKPDNIVQAFVSPTPWYALTDTNGIFVIKGVPVGNYTLQLRHKTLRVELDAAIEVVAGDNYLPVISVKNNNKHTSILRRIMVDPPAEEQPSHAVSMHRAKRQYWEYLTHLQRVNPNLILERVE